MRGEGFDLDMSQRMSGLLLHAFLCPFYMFSMSTKLSCNMPSALLSSFVRS